MQKKVKVLFVAYFFPPVDSGGIPGAMRILKFLKYLHSEGYVLTQKSSATRNPDQSIDTELPAERIVRAGIFDPFGVLLKLQFQLKQAVRKLRFSQDEPEVKVQATVFADSSKPIIKSAAGRFKDFIYHLNYFPDKAGAWILPAFLAGRRQVASQNIDVIFATGSPWSSLVVGYLLSKACRKPLIVDFRDPWVNNPFHRTKGPLLDRWSERLEHRIIKHAVVVSLNTERLREEFVSRYKELNEQKFIVLPNGFDEANNDIVRYSAAETKSDLVIRHAGFLYGPRNPSVLLDAIRRVNENASAKGISRRWVFEQIGAVSLSYELSEVYADMISDGSFRLLEQVPYNECQQLLQNAALLLNIQPGTKTQVPSKIYDYLSASRPILNITARDGALGHMVVKYGLGACFDFSEADLLAQYLDNKLNDLSWITDEVYVGKEVFSIKTIAEHLDSIFSREAGK